MTPAETDPAESPAERLTPEAAGRLMKLATYASVAVATVLIAAKSVAWVMTDSVSMLSTLVDSCLDAAASVVNMLAVRQALVPPDPEHRFGHGKAEPLAGLAQAAFVGGSAVFLLFQALERLVNPHPVVNTQAGYVVLALSIALTLALVLFQRSVVRRTGSVAIGADSLHYKTDLLVNLSVAVSLVLAGPLGLVLADPLFALAIGGYILKSAWDIAAESMNLLMDRELPDEDRQRIRAIVDEHPKVLSMHDLRTRSAGPQTFIQLHIVMDAAISLKAAHAIADEVMFAIENAYPGAEVLVHQDPWGIDEDHPELAKE